MTDYKSEILSIFEDNICIGFMARRSVILGLSNEIPDGWMITKDIKNPVWKGNYSIRKKAKEELNQAPIEAGIK